MQYSVSESKFSQMVILLLLAFFPIAVAAPVFALQEDANVSRVPSVTNVAGQAETQFFEVDNDHSSLIFAVSHAGISYTYGRFEKCGGQILLHEDRQKSRFDFEVDVASINTNSRLRDDHLRGEEFFDAAKHPQIKFSSTSVEIDPVSGDYTVTGAMLMHGVERNVRMPVTLTGIGKGPLGKTRGGFMTRFTINRSDFGIDAMPKIIGDQIAITFSFEGILSDAPEVVASQPAPTTTGNP